MSRVPSNRRDLTDEEVATLAVLGSRGARQVDAASRLGLDPKTLRSIFERDQRARAAWDQGRAELHQELVGNLIAIASDKNHPKAVVATFGLLNNLFGWRKDGGHGDAPAVGITIKLPEKAQLKDVIDIEEMNTDATRE